MQIKLLKTGILLPLLIVFFTGNNAFAKQNTPSLLNTQKPHYSDTNLGWWHPYTGAYTGSWEASVGFHIWNDKFFTRNLQLRQTLFLAPGTRINSVLRSNKDLYHTDRIDPSFDELYLEHFGFHYGKRGTFSYSLKLGKTRYLRFPYPDLISMFDQVPGTEDLQEGIQSNYQGLILSTEYAHNSGLGLHHSGIAWLDSEQSGITSIEQYIFYRSSVKNWEMELRWGALQNREKPLGRASAGYSAYLGRKWNGYRAGLLYEFIEDEGIRTGILVEFAPSPVTEWLGKVHFDYTRSPEGIGLQLTLAKGLYSLEKQVPEQAKILGEIQAERSTTYWENGQGRNFYEHMISKTGNTTLTPSSPVKVAIVESPIYLRIESLVSKHNSFQNWEDFKEWERKRQGPAQLAQKIRYIFYTTE